MGFARRATRIVFSRIEARVARAHAMLLESIPLVAEHELGCDAASKQTLLAGLATASRCTTAYLWSACDEFPDGDTPPLVEIATLAARHRRKRPGEVAAEPMDHLRGLIAGARSELRYVRRLFVRFDAGERLIRTLSTALECLEVAAEICTGPAPPRPSEGPQVSHA